MLVTVNNVIYFGESVLNKILTTEFVTLHSSEKVISNIMDHIVMVQGCSLGFPKRGSKFG